jgi:hypothetical protein
LGASSVSFDSWARAETRAEAAAAVLVAMNWRRGKVFIVRLFSFLDWELNVIQKGDIADFFLGKQFARFLVTK